MPPSARLIYPLPFSPLTGAGVGPSQIGERGGAIWNDRLTWVSRLTGGAKLLGFVCGMLQVSPGRYPPAVTPGRYRPIPLVVLYLLVLLAFSVSPHPARSPANSSRSVADELCCADLWLSRVL